MHVGREITLSRIVAIANVDLVLYSAGYVQDFSSFVSDINTLSST